MRQLQKEVQALKDALGLKNDEISFLRAMIHQLTEKITLALRPYSRRIGPTLAAVLEERIR